MAFITVTRKRCYLTPRCTIGQSAKAVIQEVSGGGESQSGHLEARPCAFPLQRRGGLRMVPQTPEEVNVQEGDDA